MVDRWKADAKRMSTDAGKPTTVSRVAMQGHKGRDVVYDSTPSIIFMKKKSLGVQK